MLFADDHVHTTRLNIGVNLLRKVGELIWWA